MLYSIKDMPTGLGLPRVLNATNIRRISGEITSPDCQELIWKMIKACVNDGGIGLAAPQIGVFKRIFIAEQEKGVFRAFINPSFCVLPGTRKENGVEGCLSVPGKRVSVSRFISIEASWHELNENGGMVLQTLPLMGLAARVFQHELDHLNGISILEKSTKK